MFVGPAVQLEKQKVVFVNHESCPKKSLVVLGCAKVSENLIFFFFTRRTNLVWFLKDVVVWRGRRGGCRRLSSSRGRAKMLKK